MEHFQLCFKINLWFHTQIIHIKIELCALKFLVYIWEETPSSDTIYSPPFLWVGNIISMIAILQQWLLKILGTILQGYPLTQPYIPLAESSPCSSACLQSWKSPPQEGAIRRAWGISISQQWDTDQEELPLSTFSTPPPISVTQETFHEHEFLGWTLTSQLLHPTMLSCLEWYCIFCNASQTLSCPLIPFSLMTHKSPGINRFSQVSSAIS